ncbi:54S ribosomal L36, mitochondrial [Lecanosticta acicola]|uniref:54S ribosomal L36, mitochondrial n=1 Tax=Lecanosticta acicola TaxID=111012 RepID=A0AAI8Z1F7_9PEZI|nr:54S ribosomal L36, mitochondrial [Lecanosticta acicola]
MSLSTSLRRPICASCRRAATNQVRHATLLRRPKKPYTFTQMITLSDGSTFLHRTTSPQPIYRSTKDTKNSPLWNPSSQKLLNVEEDEAGRLRRFRARFGRGFDAEALEGGEEAREGEEALKPAESQESLLDLISSVGKKAEKKGEAAGVREPAKKSGKGKGGEK